jgi:hypothetical protein
VGASPSQKRYVEAYKVGKREETFSIGEIGGLFLVTLVDEAEDIFVIHALL